MGAHLGLPLLRQRWHAEITEAEATTLLQDCMRVCFYRNTQAGSNITIGKVDATGASVSAPIALETYWEYPEYVKGGGHGGDGSW